MLETWNLETMMYAIGDRVEKTGGDYTFAGVVVAAFAKRSGAIHYVVEDDRGCLHIFSGPNLQHRPRNPPPPPDVDGVRG
jgi:hypothetical protein